MDSNNKCRRIVRQRPSTVNALVASTQKPQFGFLPVDGIHRVTIGHPILFVIRRETSISQSGRAKLSSQCSHATNRQNAGNPKSRVSPYDKTRFNEFTGEIEI